MASVAAPYAHKMEILRRFILLFTLMASDVLHADRGASSPVSEITKRLSDLTFNEMQLSGFFCPDDEPCTQREAWNNTKVSPESLSRLERELREATVTLELKQIPICSATVISLKKNGKTCKKPLLLTASHCLGKRKKELRENLGNGNFSFSHPTKGRYRLQSNTIRRLPDICMTEMTIPHWRDKQRLFTEALAPKYCLYNESSKNSSDNWLEEFDQDLIPIDTGSLKLKPAVIDLNQLDTAEFTRCMMSDGKGVKITSSTPRSIIKRELKPKTPTVTHSCNYGQLKGEYFEPLGIRHNCPSALGFSGSNALIRCRLNGKNKMAIGVNSRTSRSPHDETPEGYYFTRPRRFPEEGRGSNTLQFIYKESLEFYYKNHCKES